MSKETVKHAGDAAEIDFFDPVSSERRRIKFEYRTMWRGDHRSCSHASGRCIAARGWILTHGTMKLKPHVVPISIEERAMATAKEKGKGNYAKPTQEAKGMVEVSSVDLVAMAPSPAVVQWHIERAIREKKGDMERRGAQYETVEKALKDLRAKIESANAVPRKADS